MPSRGTIKKIKRQVTEREEIFVKRISDKGQRIKIYEELSKLM